MLRAASLALGLVVASMLAASGCDGDAAAPVAANAAAGRVVEVAGRVTATRGGQPRALAAGGEVFADDVIETAADGSIVIELAHNGARWSLEGGMRSRVDASVAWGLERGAVVAVENATSAAGRHAEKQAADTAATATVSGAAPAEAPAAAPAVAAANDADREQAARARAAEEARAERASRPKQVSETARRPEPKEPPARGAAAAGCDEVNCLLDPSRACCARLKLKSGGGASGAGTPAGLPETLERGELKRVLDALRPRLVACGAGHDVHGTLRLAIRIGPDGKVRAAEVVEGLDPAIDACAIRVARTATFSRSQRGTSLRYPVVF